MKLILHMFLAVASLTGNTLLKSSSIEKLDTLLEEKENLHIADDPQVWARNSNPYYAVRISYLKNGIKETKSLMPGNHHYLGQASEVKNLTRFIENFSVTETPWEFEKSLKEGSDLLLDVGMLYWFSSFSVFKGCMETCLKGFPPVKTVFFASRSWSS